MFLRYIIDFFEYYFYRDKYRKQNFYVNLLNRVCPKYHHSSQKRTSSEVDLKQWVNQFKAFEKIIVCASGVSLNRLKKLSKKNLYIATNSSVSKVINYHFIYFTFTREYINLYLRLGFKNQGWEGTIFRFTQSKADHKIRMNSYRRASEYLSKFQRSKPELLLSNIQNEGMEASNFNEINQFIRSKLNFDFNDENSGISILLLGFYFASKLNKPLEVYGLDAGITGNQYYNKRGHPGKEISNEKTIESLSHILNEIKKNTSVQFMNHSFFKPKT